MPPKPAEATSGGARIGPNSVLQLVPVLDKHLGSGARKLLLSNAGLTQLPSDNGLMDEAPAARVHQVLRLQYPLLAEQLAREAGRRTADYILAHRIPPLAQRAVKALPRRLGAAILARAVERHAWTFAGSGTFRISSLRPLVFELEDNPVVRGETAATPICAWHAAVFERLFRVLVDPRAECRETSCCASGSRCCRFELR